MPDPNPDHAPTDALLVAYLDGELGHGERADVERRLIAEGGLRDRLARLEDGNRPFAQAFAPLLEDAPVGRLEDMLAAARRDAAPRDAGRLAAGQPAALPEAVRSDTQRAKPSGNWRLALAASLVAAFCAGLATAELAGMGFRPSPQIEEADTAAHWRQVVAEYQALYTPDSVASIPDDDEARRKELEAVGAKLGVELSPEGVALPGLEFKRAQIFGYDGATLGQLTYLDSARRVLALCIIGDGQPAAPIRRETREGLPIAYWARNGRSYMLIGSVPGQDLDSLAANVSARL